jgi:hypothetical protein
MDEHSPDFLIADKAEPARLHFASGQRNVDLSKQVRIVKGKREHVCGTILFAVDSIQPFDDRIGTEDHFNAPDLRDFLSRINGLRGLRDQPPGDR